MTSSALRATVAACVTVAWLGPGCGDDAGETSAGSTGAEATTSGGPSSGPGTTVSGSGTDPTSGSSDPGSGSTGSGTTSPDESTTGSPFDGDISCLGDPFEVEGDPVTVEGNVLGPIGGIEALIEVLDVSDDSVIASMMTGTDGAYTLSVPTGGAPTAVYFHITAPGHVETFRYFGYPLTDDAPSGQRVWSDVEFADYASLAGITPEAGTGVLRLAPRDCSLALTGQGTTVTTSPAAPTLIYEGGTECVPDARLTAATGCGFAMAYDMPPGSADVDAMVADVEFYGQTVRVEADAMTWVTLQPDRS